jgi:heme exporter protein A
VPPDSPPALLCGRGLLLIRGDRLLFGDLAFSVAPGELLQIEGANGSGTTSLLRVIAGLLPPEEGEVCWRQKDIARHRQSLHDELVWLGHRPGFKGDLTLAENLRFEAGLRRSARPLAEVFERLGIGALAHLPVRVLSAGQQRRGALARMLLAGALLWLLDEPLTNLDADGQVLASQLLDEHLAAGGLAVMASHRDLALRAPVQRIRLS